jgi:hypothetical protein
MEDFPVNKETFDKAFGTIVPKGHNLQVIVGLTSNSKLLFGSIKSALLPLLRLQNVYMHPHSSTSWKSLDVIPIAHLHEVHPTFADLTQVKENLIAMFEKATEQAHSDEDFQKLTGDNEPSIPEIMLYKGRAQGNLRGQDIHSDVTVVQNLHAVLGGMGRACPTGCTLGCECSFYFILRFPFYQYLRGGPLVCERHFSPNRTHCLAGQ